MKYHETGITYSTILPSPSALKIPSNIATSLSITKSPSQQRSDNDTTFVINNVFLMFLPMSYHVTKHHIKFYWNISFDTSHRAQYRSTLHKFKRLLAHQSHDALFFACDNTLLQYMEPFRFSWTFILSFITYLELPYISSNDYDKFRPNITLVINKGNVRLQHVTAVI